MDSPGKKKYKCGLVLSGGAVRGFALAGALKAMNELGIFPDVIAGSSAGTIVGSLYCDGYRPDEIREIFNNKSLYKFLEFIIPNRGLVKMTGMQHVLVKNLRAKTFEELRIPLYVTLTNLNHGRAVYVSSGELVKNVIASCTIPLLFTPVVMDGITYVDGGVINNLPLEPIEGLCETVIGVNVNPIGYVEQFDSMMKVTDRAVHIIIESAIAEKKKRMDLVIEPMQLNKFGLLDMDKGMEMYQIGYEEAKRVLPEFLSRRPEVIAS